MARPRLLAFELALKAKDAAERTDGKPMNPFPVRIAAQLPPANLLRLETSRPSAVQKVLRLLSIEIGDGLERLEEHHITVAHLRSSIAVSSSRSAVMRFRSALTAVLTDA